MNFFNPLTCNRYTIKDSFDAVTRLKNITQELFDQCYRFLSFDVVSLFTSESLQKNNQHYTKKRLCRKRNKHYYKEKYYEKI